MHGRHVRLASLAMATLIAAAAALFGWSADRGAPPVTPATARPGAALFRHRCARCHSAAALEEDLSRAPDRTARITEITELLESHGDATPEEDRQIVDELASPDR